MGWMLLKARAQVGSIQKRYPLMSAMLVLAAIHPAKFRAIPGCRGVVGAAVKQQQNQKNNKVTAVFLNGNLRRE